MLRAERSRLFSGLCRSAAKSERLPFPPCRDLNRSSVPCWLVCFSHTSAIRCCSSLSYGYHGQVARCARTYISESFILSSCSWMLRICWLFEPPTRLPRAFTPTPQARMALTRSRSKLVGTLSSSSAVIYSCTLPNACSTVARIGDSRPHLVSPSPRFVSAAAVLIWLISAFDRPDLGSAHPLLGPGDLFSSEPVP
jgi:hypothetical protein